jgi:hypothetical protein
MAIIGTLFVLREHGCPDSGISQSPALQYTPEILRWYMMQREMRASLHPHGLGRIQSANLTIRHASVMQLA